MARGFKYQPPKREDVEKRATQQGGDFVGYIKDEFQTYAPKPGNNWVRLLPRHADEGAKLHGLEVWQHYSIGPQGGSVLCNYKMGVGPCPVCEAMAEEARNGADDATIKALKPSRKVLYWVIDKNDPSKGPLIWSMSWTIDRDINGIMIDRQTGELYDPFDPDNGYNISFTRIGEKLHTKYSSFATDRKPSQVDQDFLDWVADEDNWLPNVLIHRTYDEVNHIFTGGGPKQTSHRDEPDERPARREEPEERPRSPISSRRSAPDDEERPAPRRGRDEDEEERPRRGREDPDERPSRREDPEERPRSRRDDPEDELPQRSRREDPEDDRPARREEPDERPASGGGKASERMRNKWAGRK